MSAAPTIHASCVAIGGAGVLLRGSSGAGKSDLALRLIDGGAVLVADDRVLLSAEGGVLAAACPDRLAGLLEVRGLGIVELPWEVGPVPVRLVADLVAPGAVERLPDTPETVLEGVRVAHLRLAAFEASAPARLRLALAVATGQCNRIAGAGPQTDQT